MNDIFSITAFGLTQELFANQRLAASAILSQETLDPNELALLVEGTAEINRNLSKRLQIQVTALTETPAQREPRRLLSHLVAHTNAKDWREMSEQIHAKKIQTIMKKTVVEGAAGNRKAFERLQAIAEGSSSVRETAQFLLQWWDEIQAMSQAQDPLNFAKIAGRLTAEGYREVVQNLALLAPINQALRIAIYEIDESKKRQDPKWGEDTPTQHWMHDRVDRMLTQMEMVLSMIAEGRWSPDRAALRLETCYAAREDLGNVWHQAYTQNQLAASAKRIKIYDNIPPLGLTLKPEHAEIVEDALIELVHNAIKYCDDTKPEKEITVHWNVGRGQLTVKDNGIGISDPAAVLEGKREAPDKAEGTGLGLKSHKARLESIGWKLLVESTPRVGTTFTLIPPAGAFSYFERILEEFLSRQRRHFKKRNFFDLDFLIPEVTARFTTEEKILLAKQLFWQMRQICLDFYEVAKKLAENDAEGLEKLIAELHQSLNRLGKLFPKSEEEDEKFQRLIERLKTSSLTLPIGVRNIANMLLGQLKRGETTWRKLGEQINPDSFIVERVLFGENIYRVNSLQKELFDILQMWLQNYGDLTEQSLNEKIWSLRFSKKDRLEDLFQWPPDPEGDIPLKTYLELLGWTMTVATSGDSIIVKIAFANVF